jgi:hypothetical protein
MMRPTFVLTLAILGAGCMTRGNGEPLTEVREVDPFHAIDVGGVFQVQAKQGAERRVEVRGDSNLVPRVEVESKGGRLRAHMTGNVIPNLPLVLVLVTPELDEIELSGASRAEVTAIDGASLEVEVSGASTLVLQGKATKLEADISGASDLEAKALVSDHVEIDSSGASSAEITANASLVAEASGASSVVWFGSATKVSREVSGASSIDHR